MTYPVCGLIGEIRLFNKTTNKFIIDADSDDGSPYKTYNITEAIKTLGVVNDLKRLNPNHADDDIEIRLYYSAQ